MSSRTPLAWKNLTHDPRRLVVASCGVAFAVLLMFMEMGFLNALLDSTVGAPGEPMAFGSDVDAIWELLAAAPDWFAVEVEAGIAEQLGSIVTRELGVPVRYLNDIYHVLPGSPVMHRHSAVRSLTVEDLPLLERGSADLWGPWIGDGQAALAAGVVAGAIEDGRVIAICQAAPHSERYAELGADTLAAYRQRGYATAAASLVAERVCTQGKTPVWSCGEMNLASRRVAAKLGFVEVSRRVYVVVGD
jgi:hypothetical protein